MLQSNQKWSCGVELDFLNAFQECDQKTKALISIEYKHIKTEEMLLHKKAEKTQLVRSITIKISVP